jgi:hypothetical protein
MLLEDEEMGIIEVGIIVYIGVLAAIAIKSKKRMEEQLDKIK